MERLLQDGRHALRQLRTAPGFAVTAILTLALGIGATTAIFTLVYDVLMKPLPYEHPERLVVLEEQVAEFRDLYPKLPMSANHFVTWERNLKSVQAMAALREGSMPLGTGGHPLQLRVLSATPGIFSVLGVAPQLGRSFTAEEGQEGHEHVVVLTNGLWRTQFQSDQRILGKTITLNGYTYTVIGVMPKSFHPPMVQSIIESDSDRAEPIGALLPLVFSKDELAEANGNFNYFVLARLKPGVSVARAGAEVNALQHTITSKLSAQEMATLSGVVTPFQELLVGSNRTPLLLLLAAVAGLLLVGCVNITNLLLSRAVSRRQQLAVAAALGASRSEMVRMAMRETAVLATIGGALGIALASALVPMMQHYLPRALDFRGTLHLDWTGTACAVALAVAATILAGAAPRWIVSRTQPGEVLHSEARLASESRGSKRLRRVLVAVEVAVSVALVFTTGLLATSLVRLTRIDRGFETERLLTAKVNLPRKSYQAAEARAAFYQRVLDRLQVLPGVEHAGMVSQIPLAGDRWIDMIRVDGDPRPFLQLPTEHFRWISPGYLEAIHLPLVSGRYMTAADTGKRVALVSDLTARTLWPGTEAVGRHFSRGGAQEESFTVIGVIKDARTISLAAPDPMMVYVPYWYRCDDAGSLLMRTRQAPGTMADAFRKTIWSVEPEASIPVVRSLGGVLADSVSNRRFEMDLLLLFAISALLLAGLGVYGVVTYSVVQRQREIGLRLALGAQSANIYRLVLSDGLTPVLAGTVAGVAMGFGCARIVGSLLFQVSPYSPVVVGGAVAALVAVGTAACLIPARRAAAVDPMRALRTE